MWNNRDITFAAACCELNSKQQYELYQALKARFPSETFYELFQVYDALPSRLRTWIQKHSIEAVRKQYIEENIQIVYIEDEDYPKRLREIFEPPIILFCKGDLSLLQSMCLGMVGGRFHTPYGEQVIDYLITYLAPHECTVVSGLARGIDTLSHKWTLKHHGKTIAVIGTGLNRAYPKENEALQEYIATHGLLISEYPLDSLPLKFHFPYRNRIIAGLSHGLCVVEAKKRSGSLITANLALSYNRNVFAVPGSIFSPFSTGTNELLIAGAIPVLDGESILKELNYYW